jgi:hypothetical protein
VRIGEHHLPLRRVRMHPSAGEDATVHIETIVLLLVRNVAGDEIDARHPFLLRNRLHRFRIYHDQAPTQPQCNVSQKKPLGEAGGRTDSRKSSVGQRRPAVVSSVRVHTHR